MGMLHKLVFILGKLDPRNEQWEKRQIDRVKDAIKAAEKIEDAATRERTLKDLEQQIADIEEAFERNELDYGRKLYLIENCIYGVDIQPIAVQIAKMRFFISLDRGSEGLTTRSPTSASVRCPTWKPSSSPPTRSLASRPARPATAAQPEIDAKEAELRRVRERHFIARTPATKAKCRDDDAKLRAEIAELLKHDGWDTATARNLAVVGSLRPKCLGRFFRRRNGCLVSLKDLTFVSLILRTFPFIPGNLNLIRIQRSI